MSLHRRGPQSDEDDRGSVDDGPMQGRDGSQDDEPFISDYRRQPPRAAKDHVYTALLDNRWHSANELHTVVGLEYLTAIGDLVRAGYAINRKKNSFLLVSRWPTPPNRNTQPAAVESKIGELTSAVSHTIEEDLNFARLGDATRPGRDNDSLDLGDEDRDYFGEDDDPDREDQDDLDAAFSDNTQDSDPDDTLAIGEGAGLPAKLMVTLKLAILAKSGAGKTSAAIVIAEEMCKSSLPFCVIDPMGVWWGLRARSDKEFQGFPVLVMGGEHGDVPLGLAHGSLAAQLVVKRYPLPTILDLSNMTPDEQHGFVTAFVTEFYARNRRPIHLFIDEADEFAPQKPEGQIQKTVLGVMDRMVRRGRLRGIGVTLITQRSAVLHKNVLSQVDMLVAMCSVSPADLRAVRDWLDGKVSQRDLTECLGSISSLPVGGAYVLASGRLNVFKKLIFRRKETFDASATPGFGEEPQDPPKMVKIPDLKSVQTFMNIADDVDDNEPPPSEDR